MQRFYMKQVENLSTADRKEIACTIWKVLSVYIMWLMSQAVTLYEKWTRSRLVLSETPLSTYWEVQGCVGDPVGWVKIRSFSLLVNSISSVYLSRISAGSRKEVLPWWCHQLFSWPHRPPVPRAQSSHTVAGKHNVHRKIWSIKTHDKQLT